MEERSVGKLPQHGRSLGLHDLSGGTMSYVSSGRSEGSCPLAVAKGWNSMETTLDVVY